MLLLTAVTQAQPDYVALAMVIVLLIFVAAATLRKRFSSRKGQKAEVSEAPKVEAVQPTVAPGSAGTLKMYNVEPKTAAMLMAIVAHKMDKPLNEIRFISIKEVTK